MKKLKGKTSIVDLTDFKLDALSTFWQFDKTILAKLENFISERFKYPKGGGWDLDSLREDILEQNDLLEIDKTNILLPDELATNQKIALKNQDAIQLISEELLHRYKPNLTEASDQQTIREISQVIYAMEAVRLGVFKPTIEKKTLPSNMVDLMRD